MMTPMTFVDDALAGCRVIVEFPEGGVADWIVAGEVLLQEGLRAWALPVGSLALLPEVLALFGRRARVGVSRVLDADGVRSAVAAGAHFVTSPLAGADLVEAAGGVPFLPGGLTPQEIADAARLGRGAAQVVPADIMGSGYSRTLPALLPGVELVATGRLEHYQCDLWLEAGARAVGVQGVLLLSEEHDAQANEPGELRRRCQQFADLKGN